MLVCNGNKRGLLNQPLSTACSLTDLQLSLIYTAVHICTSEKLGLDLLNPNAICLHITSPDSGACNG